MKKTKIQLIFQGLMLGMFLGTFFISTGNVAMAAEGNEWNAPKCSQYENEQVCQDNPACGWTVVEAGKHECKTTPDRCSSLFAEQVMHDSVYLSAVDDVEREALYAEVCGVWECVMLIRNDEGATNLCRQESSFCEGLNQHGCIAPGTGCSWSTTHSRCQEGGGTSPEVAGMWGICHCESKDDASKMVNVTTENCLNETNDFWTYNIPKPCISPATVSDVQYFCGKDNLRNPPEGGASVPATDLMTPYGRKACNMSTVKIVAEQALSCAEEVEMEYQASEKGAAANKVRLDGLEACESVIGMMDSDAVFGGPGLQGGALFTHRELTKSISHETNLNTLILGWVRFTLELVAVFAVVAVIWAGILYITDLGDGGNQEKAKKILLWVTVGILVIAGSYAIVNMLMSAGLAGIVNSFYA